MMQMKINSSQETIGNSININEKVFKRVGDVEMNQIETVGNNKDYEENMQETHKQLVTNNK